MDKYTKIFEKLEPDTAQIQKIYEKISAKSERNTEKSFSKIKRKFIIAIAVCILITSTTFATNFFGLSDSTFDFFGIVDEEQKEELLEIAHVLDEKIPEETSAQTEKAKAEVGVIQESVGGNIHFKEVVSDENLIYIFFDFYAPEGTVLDKEIYKFDTYKTTDGSDVREYGAFSTHLSYEIRQLEDDDKSDNKLPMFFQILTNDIIDQEKIVLSIENLRGFTDEEHYTNYIKTQYSDRTKEVLKLTEEDMALTMPEEEIFSNLEAYDGVWTYEFSADIESVSMHYELDAIVPVGDGEVRFTSLTISPVSATLVGSTNIELEDNGRYCGIQMMGFTVNYADGTSFASYCSGSWGGGKTFQLLQFEDVVDKEIVSITYQGMEIFLK